LRRESMALKSLKNKKELQILQADKGNSSLSSSFEEGINGIKIPKK
jgi:hypothetical protein